MARLMSTLTGLDLTLEQHLLLDRRKQRKIIGGLIETLQEAEVEHVAVLRRQVALGILRIVDEVVERLDHDAHSSEQAVDKLVVRPSFEIWVRHRVLWKLEECRDHELVHALRTIVCVLGLQNGEHGSRKELVMDIPCADARPTREHCEDPHSSRNR